MKFIRAQSQVLSSRLAEPVARIQIVAGPRQVGKSTLVRQTLVSWNPDDFTSVPTETGGIDDISIESAVRVFRAGAKRDAEWLIDVWSRSRAVAKQRGQRHVLVVDEIQKISQWSEIVKGLWDADRAAGVDMHVVLLGSAPLLMQKGLAESLAGRYEIIRMTHWALSEMQEAFDFSLEEYIYFGGYPGSASLIKDEDRWRDYVIASLIQPNIEKDILQMTRVEKPALLKLLFELGCRYSGQILALTKLRGQLEDAGNVTTLADYLHLLSQAGLLTGLQKFAVQQVRQRASPPKLNVLNTALMTARSGYTFGEAEADRAFWGRLVESAVGAHLINSADQNLQISYWRQSPFEVDFVLSNQNRIQAIEVKSGKFGGSAPGLEKFKEHFPAAKSLVIGDAKECNISIAEFLTYPATHWVSVDAN